MANMTEKADCSVAEVRKKIATALASALRDAKIEHGRTFPAPEYKAANISLGGLRNVATAIFPETLRMGNDEATAFLVRIGGGNGLY